MPLSEMLKAVKEIVKIDDYHHTSLTENFFPLPYLDGEVIIPKTIRALDLKSGSVYMHHGVRLLRERGMRPANIPELLMLAINEPELVIENSVVALTPSNPIACKEFCTGVQTYSKRSYCSTISKLPSNKSMRPIFDTDKKPELCLSCEGDYDFGIRSGMKWMLAAIPI